MSYEPRLIAPYFKESGLNLYFKPWIIGDDAFVEADDVFTWRGSIRKRDGVTLLGRVDPEVSISDISMTDPAVVTTSANHNLQDGDQVWLEGITATDYTDLNNTLFNITTITLTTFSLQSLLGADIDKSTAAGVGADGNVFLPIQHLGTRIVPNTLDEQLVAFTSVRAFVFNTVTELFQDITFDGNGTFFPWSGGANNYHWSSNYVDAMWVTNNVDRIRFWQGSTVDGWSDQEFQINTTDFVFRALMIFPYKNRLVILNTSEGTTFEGTRHSQRARWSKPFASPFTTNTSTVAGVNLPPGFTTNDNAWREDIQGNGGFADAATNEQIVTAGIINDNLIVGFQRSTWRLRWTGNQILPFIWDEINSHYGAESTHGTIGFDKLVYMYSRFGYVGADTNNVRRIDQKIPDQSFGTETGVSNQELVRVASVRDFYRNIFYWAYPESADNAKTNNKVLTYNNDEGTWSKFNLSCRTFGSYKSFNDVTWTLLPIFWSNKNEPWNDPSNQSNYPHVVCGTDSSHVDIVFEQGPGIDNQVSQIMAITAASPAVITTKLNHGLNSGDKVILDNIGGTMGDVLNDTTQIVTYIDAVKFSVPVDTTTLTHTPDSGTVTPTSALFGFNVRTKSFNPYIDQGRDCRLEYVDVYITGTSVGEATLEHYINANNDTPVQTVTFSTAIPADAKYTRIFLGETAQFHMLRLFLTDTQLESDVIASSIFELQGMVIWTRPTSRIKDLALL